MANLHHLTSLTVSRVAPQHRGCRFLYCQFTLCITVKQQMTTVERPSHFSFFLYNNEAIIWDKSVTIQSSFCFLSLQVMLDTANRIYCWDASPDAAASPEGKGTKLYETFFTHKMTWNNTLNKDSVAATELPQLLSQNTNMFGEATIQSRCQTMCSCEVNFRN